MAYFRNLPQDFTETVEMQLPNDINENFIVIPDYTGLVKPQIELQCVGYEDDFPLKNCERPPQTRPANRSFGEVFQKLESSKNSFNIDSVAIKKRVIDIINHCRYLASKRGMDKRQLLVSIKRDELEGKHYLHTFNPYAQIQPCLHPLGMQFSSNTDWIGSDTDYETECSQGCQGKGDNDEMSQPLKCCPKLVPEPEDVDYIKSDTDSYGHGPRPPTRRTTSNIPFVIKEELLKSPTDEFESSGESDFDPSETADLLQELKLGLKNDSKERRDGELEEYDERLSLSSIKIPAIRTPATHNFSILQSDSIEIVHPYQNRSREVLSDSEDEREMSMTSCAGSEEVSNSPSTKEELSTAIGLENEDDESRAVIIKTARAHACASYAQIRQKWQQLEESQTEKPIFGNFNEFDSLLLDDSRTSSPLLLEE